METATAIRELRKRLGLTQQKLAFQTDLSIAGIVGYENKTRKPETAPLVRLATIAARAGHHDLAHVFLSELTTQLRLQDLSTGLLKLAQSAPDKAPVIPGDRAEASPGLLLLAFHDPALNGAARAFFEAAVRHLWGNDAARQEAAQVLALLEGEALKRWGRQSIEYREETEAQE